MAFRFSLESVLKFRHREEEIAQRDFTEARVVLDACLRGIEYMYTTVDSARLDISEAEKSGRPLDLEYIRQSEIFINGQKVRINKERQRARDLIADVEKKEEILLQRLHDRKIMEKLKDRRLEEYKERLMRLEQKELDDLTNARAVSLFGGVV